MHHIIFEPNTTNTYRTALLIKPNALIKDALEKHYIDKYNIPKNEIIAFDLAYQKNGKAPASFAKNYLGNLLNGLNGLNTELLIVCDSDYFKYLTGLRKIDNCTGYVHPCVIPGYAHMSVVLSKNYKSAFYNPKVLEDIDLSMRTAEAYLNNTYKPIGQNIIHSAKYLSSPTEIHEMLKTLHQHPLLACDIETYSLKFYATGISTIGFSWDKHNGTVFQVTYLNSIASRNVIHKYLKEFFDTYQGKLIFHNANYDLKVIINTLYMHNLLDQRGMIEGINAFKNKIHDTKLLAYLATNSTSKNPLGLKELAHEFAGNYAEDVTDINNVGKKELLEYNLKDCLSTFYVFDKYYPTVIQDNQEQLYNDIFIPSVFTLLQMELTGIPLDMDKVSEAEDELNKIRNDSYLAIRSNPYVKKYEAYAILHDWYKTNQEWKTKKEDIEFFVDRNQFNVNSTTQLRILLELAGLPVLEKTPTGEAAVGSKVLKKLISHSTNDVLTDLLNNVIQINETSKIINTFIKAFKRSSVKKLDNLYYLHGGFNLGGTVSGRMSSCLVGETEVQCSDGTKHLNEITKGTLVPTHTGRLCPVLNVFNNGKKPVYRITTENGKTLICTSNHRLLTESGFLSLEDLLNENETNIRRKIIAGNADCLNELPQLITITNKDYGKREILSNSKSISFTGHSRGKQEKKNFCKSTTTTEALRKKLTKRTRRLRKQYRIKSRRGSQENKNSSYHFKSVHKTETRREKVFKNIFCKKILSKVSFRSKNKGSVSSYQHRKIHRSKRIRFSAHALLDETRKQILLRASSSDVRSIENGCVTKRMGSASYQRRQNRQQIRQSGSYDPTRPYRPPSRELSSIVQIDYMGVRRVYDLEIETDHCYIANGIFVHNSNPNLQNIPSNSKYAKVIKKCFVAPPGWILVGADFDSLEDRISALITKDKNKLKVYEGHVIYELTINGTCHHIRDDTIIEYDGKTYTGEAFYEKYAHT